MTSQQKAGGLADPHANGPVMTAGVAVDQADLVVMLLHGRGATAQSILPVFDELELKNSAAIAPQAAGNTWYPNSFLAPTDSNQPYLDSALRRIGTLVSGLIDRGISSERIALLGFSQGACLASEFVAQHPRRYAALIALTGGLIGPPETPRNYSGSLSGTPVFLGAGDPDPHVPFARVKETEAVLTRMGAAVELRRYPRMPHSVNEDELEAARAMLGRAMLGHAISGTKERRP